MFKEIKKHLRLYRHMIKLSLMEQLEYRANFIIGIIVECFYLVTKLLYVYITQTAGNEIGGLTPDEVMLFIGVFMLFTALYCGLFSWNFHEISWGVRRGLLDTIIVKPVSLQFYLTLRYTDVGTTIPNIIGGFALIGIAWQRIGFTVGAVNVILFAWFMFCGLVIAYSLFLLPYLSAFWTVKTFGISEMASRAWDFNNMPMQIYNKWWQFVCMFILPIFAIINLPVMALFDNLTAGLTVWGFVVPVLAFCGIRAFWRVAVRRYSSAGG